MLFLLQDPGGGGGGDQGTDGRGLAADEPVFYHIALAVDADHFLVAILAGRGPAADIGEIRPDVRDGGASPLRQEGQTVQSIGLVVGLQKLSGFIQSKNGVLAAVEDGADNMALCALQVHAVSNLDGFQSGLPDRFHPHMDIGAGDVPLPAKVGYRAAADDGVRTIPQAGIHCVSGAFLILHIVQRNTGAAEFFQFRQQVLKPVPAQTKANVMRMVGVPALKQSLNQIHAVKPQPGDVFFRIDIADLVISNASGYDHIVVIQLIQDLRRTEPVHHIDADLIIFPFRSLLLDRLQHIWRWYKHNDANHL